MMPANAYLLKDAENIQCIVWILVTLWVSNYELGGSRPKGKNMAKIEFDEEELQALYLRCNGRLEKPNAALRRAVAKIYAAQQGLHLTGGILPQPEPLSPLKPGTGIEYLSHQPTSK